MRFKYHHLALGGTFDLLHRGHLRLISTAFKMGQKVTIGITTDKFSQYRTFKGQDIRRKSLKSYLKQNKLSNRAKIIWLNDIYGPTLKDRTIEALVITKDTKNGANLINKERLKRRLRKLKIIQVPQIKDYDGKIISSSRIRVGEIDQEGRNYKGMLLKIAGKKISEKVRAKLKTPFGKVGAKLFHPPGGISVISVGDITTKNLLANKITPKLALVDFRVQRKQVFSDLRQLGFNQVNPDVEVKNNPGQISRKLIMEIDKAIKNPGKKVILVDGEEDLGAVPATLLAPLGTQIFYGQPGKGLIKLEVTLALKAKLCQILGYS